MSIKKLESSLNGASFYSMRDKAFFYVQQRMLEAYDRIDNLRNSIDTRNKLEDYIKNVKKVFKDTMGKLPYDKDFPLNPKVTGEICEDGLTIKNVIFNSRENVYITGNLYIPAKREKKCPAVLFQCGHSGNGKAYASYQTAARIIASRGIIVLVTDPVGQGEREQYVDEDGMSVLYPAVENHQQFGNQCFLIGENSIKYFLADAIKSIDFLETLNEVDPEKIGATGVSGGGTMTSLLMAYDERIKAAAPGCWPSSGREYFLSGGAADSEQIWQNVLKNNIDVFEIMLCMCPKPLMVLGALYDYIPLEGVKKLFEETKRLYELFGSENNIYLATEEEMHGYSEGHAVSAADFFSKNLCDDKISISDVSIKPLGDKLLYATKSGRVIVDFPESLTVYEENLKEFKEAEASENQKPLKDIVYNNRPEEFECNLRHFNNKEYSFYDDGLWVSAYLWFTGEALPCFGVMFKSAENKNKKIPVTICLWTDGTNALSHNADKIREICENGRAAFVVDLFAMGKNLPHKMKGNYEEKENLASVSDKITKSLFMLGDSMGAIKAYDLMQTIKMLKKEISQDVSLYTKGNYSVFAEIAKKLTDIECDMDSPVDVGDIVTKKYYNTYDLSHIIIPGLANYLKDDKND